MRWELGAATVFVGVLACRPSVFSCSDDSECSGGLCQPTGSCSFPDDDCESGQRYGDHAAGGLSGMCVEAGQTDGAMSTSTTAATDASTLGLDGSSGLAGSTETTNDSSSTGDAIDPDLLLWFRFEDLAGGVTVDSALGIPATCRDAECPEVGEGPFGQSALFDGQDDGLTVPYDPVFATLETFTAAAWIRVDQAPDMGIRMIFGHPYGTGNFNAWLLSIRSFQTSWSGGMTMSSDGELHVLVDPMASPLGEWVHVAGTYDGFEMRMFIDGVPIGSQLAPPPVFDSNHPLTIGRDINMEQPDGWFEGALDEVRLYARALSLEEVAALAAR